MSQRVPKRSKVIEEDEVVLKDDEEPSDDGNRESSDEDEDDAVGINPPQQPPVVCDRYTVSGQVTLLGQHSTIGVSSLASGVNRVKTTIGHFEEASTPSGYIKTEPYVDLTPAEMRMLFAKRSLIIEDQRKVLAAQKARPKPPTARKTIKVTVSPGKK